MSDLKKRRQHAMADLVRSGAPASQEELADRLARLGFAATQATISRDLEQIGAVKMRRGQRLGYVLRDQVQGVAYPQLSDLFGKLVRSIDTAANLLVIKTPPGSAHLIGVALDQSAMAEIVGTICGDDTIFVACRNSSVAGELAEKMRSMGIVQAVSGRSKASSASIERNGLSLDHLDC